MEHGLSSPTAEETTIAYLYQPAQKPDVLQTLAPQNALSDTLVTHFGMVIHYPGPVESLVFNLS